MPSPDSVLGFGASGIVVEVSATKVVKRAHPGCINAIEHERGVLDRLEGCPSVVRHFSKEKHGEIILDSHQGNLRQYLQTEKDLPIPKLTVQIVECLSHIHARGVIHCEFNTTNILIDASMNAIVCDFSSSSIDGRRPESATSIESSFYRPHRRAQDSYTIQDDLFALGSLLYELVTRKKPYQGLKGNEVGRLYRDGKFPLVDHLVVGDVIAKCWAGTYDDALHVLNDLKRRYPKPQMAIQYFTKVPVICCFLVSLVVGLMVATELYTPVAKANRGGLPAA